MNNGVFFCIFRRFPKRQTYVREFQREQKIYAPFSFWKSFIYLNILVFYIFFVDFCTSKNLHRFCTIRNFSLEHNTQFFFSFRFFSYICRCICLKIQLIFFFGSTRRNFLINYKTISESKLIEYFKNLLAGQIALLRMCPNILKSTRIIENQF